MSAYRIFRHEKVLDERELATYSNEATSTLAGHEVKVLAFHGSQEELEGVPTEGTVILEFQVSRRRRFGRTVRSIGECVSIPSRGVAYRGTLVAGV